MGAIKDITGMRFGKLVVLSGPRGRLYKWLCKCDCGEMCEPQRAALNAGQKQCRKCALKNAHEHKKTHGLSNLKNRETGYGIWIALRNRCSNVSQYTRRGITVCERWNSFENFHSDMGPRPSPRHSIDRIDNDGPYSPENCRWATLSVQANNTSSNTILEFQGERKTMAQWAAYAGLNYSTFIYRILRGWSVEKSITTPTIRHAKSTTNAPI